MIFILFLLVTSISLFSVAEITPISTIYASENTTYYARVMFDNVYLYKTASDSEDYYNLYFILPQTYFVELIDESGDFYKVNYMEFTGYVKKDYVQAIDGVPEQPYLTDITFRVYSQQSLDMRSEPSTISGSSAQVASIPLYTRTIVYYGYIVGETLVEERTNIWYYCKYSADKDYYGYVYSEFCDNMTEYTLNTESVTYIDNPSFATLQASGDVQTLDSTAVGIIIAVLMVPAAIFIILILKGSKLLSKERSNSKEVRDY